MTDHLDDDTQLAAWLAGDLDDADATALERRLDAEPALGARLDSLAATLARLRRYDAVELPPDTAARLRTRLRTERAGPEPAGAAGHPPAAHDARRPAPADGSAAGSPVLGGAAASMPDAHARPSMGNGSTRTAGGGPSTRPSRGDASTRPPGSARVQRPAHRRRQTRLASLAAAVLVVVVGVGALLPQLTRGGEDATDSAEMEVAAQDSAGSASEEAPAGASSELAMEEAAGDTAASEEDRAAAASAPRAPVVVDAGAPLAFTETPGAATAAEADGEDPLAARFLTAPEAQALIGAPLEEARELSRAFVAELERAPALAAAGTTPSACLDTVLTEDTAVPARVEAFAFDGSPALAYVLVRATPDSPVLDALQVVVTDPRTCAVLARS